MGKAAAFVCAVVLSIVLVISTDTEEKSTAIDNDNFEEANEREISSQNSQQKADVGEESSSNTVSQRTTTRKQGRRRSKKKGRKESRIIPPNEELQISHGGNPPGTNVESSTPQPIDTTRNPECFCTYAYKDSSVKVQTTDRILAERDAVKLDETVSLECQSPNYKLKWINGLVFYGKAYMTCSICKEWQRNDLPICTRASSDTFITYIGHFKILPGGIINMQRGESHQFECRSTWGLPTWDSYERQNVRTENYQLAKNGEIIYVTYLDILQASDQHNGEYQCFLRSDSGNRLGSSFLRLQVYEREQSGIIPPNVEEQTSHGGNPPDTNVESSITQPIDTTRNPECFCTYAYNDSSVKVQTTDRVLAERDAVKLGETASFECQSSSHSLKWENDLVFYEKAYMTCRICKEWQRNDLPICTRSCKVPLIENGEMNKIWYSRDGSYTLFTKIRVGENVESQQTLFLRCKNGYTAVQNSALISYNPVDVTCSDGAWSKDLQCKKNATCEQPKSPKFGTVKLHGALKVGSLATYSCDPDKKLYGATTTKCLITGQWTFDAPECLRSCTVPLIENGEMGKNDIQYIRDGRNTTIFMKIRVGENVESKQTLFLRCKNGYTAVQNSTLISNNPVDVTCSDGAWSKDLQCKKTLCQGAPPLSKNAAPIIGSREHSFTIFYRCTSTYTTKIPGNVTCHFGSWIGTPTRCLYYPCYTRDLNYPGLAKPPEEYFESIESFEINCERGYRKTEGIYRITCIRGTWETSGSPCMPEDDILCPAIQRSGIFTLIYSNLRRINSTVTFVCKDDGKKIEGHNTLACQPNGTWSGQIPKCVDYVSCPEFILSQGLAVSYSKDLSVGSIASFECSQSTQDLNGSSTSRCQENGSWSNPLPFCEVMRDQKCSIHDLVISVPEDVEPDMSKVTGEYVTLGFEVKLKCVDKYLITGDPKALCEKQGKWKIGSFQCVLGCILDLDPSSHLVVEPEKEGYRIGERILLSCPPGEELSSDVEQLMCLSGFWSDSLPDCTKWEEKRGL